MAEAGARFTAAAVSDDAPPRARVCELCLSGAKEEGEAEEEEKAEEIGGGNCKGLQALI